METFVGLIIVFTEIALQSQNSVRTKKGKFICQKVSKDENILGLD